MMRRNGGMTKVVVGVVAFFGLVYFVYLYHDLSGQLKNTERSAERYRREQESVSAQLQDQIIAKDQLKQRCDNDKEQMTNRLNSLQQQYKMLKSQHEDMESEFGRLQNEKEKETEEHRKQDEERAVEYNQFKQEKSLEIASLKDTVANLEREKEQLTQQVSGLKSQLQGTLNQVSLDKQTIATLENEVQTQKDLVQQAQVRQQQIEQQYQQLQQQQQQLRAQQAANVQGGGQQQTGNHQGINMHLGDTGLHQQQQQQQQQPLGGGFLGQGLNQMQGAFQGIKQNLPDRDSILGNLVHGVGGLNANAVPQQHVGNVAQQRQPDDDAFNIADDIMKSLQEKHKPVDADLLEEQQKQHQIIPPGDHKDEPADVGRDGFDPAELGHQKHGQDMLGQDGHGIQDQHQIGRPNLDNVADDNIRGVQTLHKPDPADGIHDNRIQNQGPVNLQVQEPNLHDADKDQLLKEDALHFRPHIPAPDNQIQPQVHVDDGLRQEQLDIPLGQDKNQGDNRDVDKLGEGNMADDDDKAHLPVLNAGRV